MIAIDQDRFGVPDGNCFTACVASLLELPIDHPEMRQLADHHAHSAVHGCWQEFWRLATEIMRGHGWTWGYVDAAELGGRLAPAGWAIANGYNPAGIGHSVVMLDGVMVHDPNPARTGIVTVSYYTVMIPLARGGLPYGGEPDRVVTP